MWQIAVKLIIFISIFSHHAYGARILAVFPYPSHSHQIVFRALTMELAKRGHELIVFTTHPVKDPKLTNYTEIELHSVNELFKEQIDFVKMGREGFWTFVKKVYAMNEEMSDLTLSHPAMQRLIAPNSTEKFDLIIIQCLYFDSIYALAARFNAPMIGMSSLPLMAVHKYIFGNPLSLASAPDPFLGYTNKMSLLDRIVSIYYSLRQIYEYQTIILPIQERVLRKHFGDDMPHVSELSSNLSLLYISTHPFYTYPHALVPSIMYIGGFRISEKKGNLPPDLQTILDNSKSGFIYFSLGSNVKSSQLPVEIRNTLLATFAELPYTVIWKFETDDITVKPSNVIIRKWLPQQDILGHPNILLLMFQGGLQSTEEAIHNAVPMITFPVFSDQRSSATKLQNFGVSRSLDLVTLEKVTLKRTILEMITNPSYKENVLKLRDLLHDLPYHSMDRAIWWTEHVIRHKGLPHLRNGSRDLPWYKNELLDIIFIFCVSVMLLLYSGYLIVRYTLKKIVRVVRHVEISMATSSKKNE